MAERRMFAKTIIDSDAFLEMPVTSQLLYFHLSMRADDEGFINKPKAIMKMVGAKEDDFNILFAKKFVIPFESGVVVIKHWKIHNYIRADRIVETKYKDEKSLLQLDENDSYQLCQSSDCQMSAQVRIGKDRIGKDNSIPKGILAPSYDQSSLDAFIKMPLVTGKFHTVTTKDVEHYKELYPAVDVEQSLRNMLGWLESNPANRKTQNGIRAFITRWLGKEQNKTRANNKRSAINFFEVEDD